MSGENRRASFTVGPRTVMRPPAILMLFAALAAAALGDLANSAWAIPIRDLESGPDTRPRTLIQFPKLILGGDSQRNASGSPSPTAGQDAAQDYEVALGGSAPGGSALGGSARGGSALSGGAPGENTSAAARSPMAGSIDPDGTISVRAATGPAALAAAGQDRSSGSSVPEPASIVMIVVASLVLYFFGRRWSQTQPG